jgi:alkanesulfonate monooxygenase SsuD/methylene tetrahydromethanopterin reductase-like flavin-dependent oxidoreductase (luciferase family)
MAMTYGIHLPQYGRVAGGEAVTRAARHAEALGFHDVWVSDHVVHPAEQSYPSPYLLDPFATLSWAAAVTERCDWGPACWWSPSTTRSGWPTTSPPSTP